MSADFEAARQRKIEEIRRTGRTWQWPDVIQRHRPRRPVDRKTAAKIAFVWLIAAGWCAVTTVWPKLSSWTWNEVYGLFCIGVGWMTCDVLRRRQR